MSVLFLPEISNQFVELAEILYDKGYMSFLDAAKDVYDVGGDAVYLVRYISNNHVIAHHLELES